MAYTLAIPAQTGIHYPAPQGEERKVKLFKTIGLLWAAGYLALYYLAIRLLPEPASYWVTKILSLAAILAVFSLLKRLVSNTPQLIGAFLVSTFFGLTFMALGALFLQPHLLTAETLQANLLFWLLGVLLPVVITTGLTAYYAKRQNFRYWRLTPLAWQPQYSKALFPIKLMVGVEIFLILVDMYRPMVSQLTSAMPADLFVRWMIQVWLQLGTNGEAVAQFLAVLVPLAITISSSRVCVQIVRQYLNQNPGQPLTPDELEKLSSYKYLEDTFKIICDWVRRIFHRTNYRAVVRVPNQQ